MYNCIKLGKLDDYFIGYNQRSEKGVFFYRINAYNIEIEKFILNYYNEARICGIVIEGKLQNPDEKNLSYYQEMMGNDFQLNEQFFSMNFRKWLPRLTTSQREDLAKSLYSVLYDMKLQGKNDGMLKNAYIKFMCWLYYRFERILNQLGGAKVPKILYEGNVSKYELDILTILSKSGADIVLLQYKGDSDYLKVDTKSKLSMEYKVGGMTAFPPNFSISNIRDKIKSQNNQSKIVSISQQVQSLQHTKPSIPQQRPHIVAQNQSYIPPVVTVTIPQRLQEIRAEFLNCTNVWASADPLVDVVTDIDKRGNDKKLFYNCFFELIGVDDKMSYANNLYQMYVTIKGKNRNVFIVNNNIEKPNSEEISHIKRNNYRTSEEMLNDISNNILYQPSSSLTIIMKKAFFEILKEEIKKDTSISKLTEKAVYLICWLNRYKFRLFPQKWEQSDIALFIYFGACKDEKEALFLRFLSRLPIDVLIIQPNKNEHGIVEDKFLFSKEYEYSMDDIKVFPSELTNVRLGTVAYHAEQELNTVLYQDSGVYRNQQYRKANAITLHTMYEEISILWNQEMRYRPNFSVVDDIVNMPIIFAKVSGVKDGNVSEYWKNIKKLLLPDILIDKTVSYTQSGSLITFKQYEQLFFKNGKVQKDIIKKHSAYKFGYLREDIQDYMLDKLQLLIDSKIIKGTFEQGMEYHIVSTVLDLNKDVVRAIQKFDFTKVPPKIVCINTKEASYSLEDSIKYTYLNLIGFDIVFFVPTGYQTIEQHLNFINFDDHQIGEYKYGLSMPDLRPGMSNNRSLKERLFGR